MPVVDANLGEDLCRGGGGGVGGGVGGEKNEAKLVLILHRASKIPSEFA